MGAAHQRNMNLLVGAEHASLLVPCLGIIYLHRLLPSHLLFGAVWYLFFCCVRVAFQ